MAASEEPLALAKEDQQMPSEIAIATAAQCWCDPRTEVVLYLLFLPKALKALKGHRLAGAVIYPADPPLVNEVTGRREGVRKREVSFADAEVAKDLVVKWIQRVGADEEPVRTPSWAECRYCDIADCPDRAEEPVAETTTEEF